MLIVQMFQWSWASVAKECAYLGSAGYTHVQVSPATEHTQGDKWYTSYAPVSYKLDSKLGSRADFASMVKTCQAAGVGIVADVIWNHMAAFPSDTSRGVNGSSYSTGNFPAVPYGSSDFHAKSVCPTSSGSIEDWDNQTQVRFCNLLELADLATEKEYVRATIAANANDLISLGVAGFRLDAAKMIAPADLENIKSRQTKDVYWTQEVTFGGADPPQLYTSLGSINQFNMSGALLNIVTSEGLSRFSTFSAAGWGWAASSVANTFVANHDTERNGGTLNYKSPNNGWTIAHVMMLALPYGTPTILSSYNFTDIDAGAPNNNQGVCEANGASSTGWRCDHRWPAIVGMVQLRNVAGSAAVTNFKSATSQRISFARQGKAFVAINNEGSSWSTTFASTTLAAGTYCNAISGRVIDGKCAGTTYIVDTSGSVTATIPAYSALGLYKPDGTSSPSSSSPSTSLGATVSARTTSSVAPVVTSSSSASVPINGLIGATRRLRAHRGGRTRFI